MNKIILTTAVAFSISSLAMPANAQTVSVDAQARIGADTQQEEHVSERIYQVTVDGGRRDSRQEVFEEALYMAAKKTLRNDYDWFRVIDRHTEKETTRSERRPGFSARYERVPERRCGLLSCTTTYRDYYRGGIGTGMPPRKDSVYTVSLDFEMGYGYYRPSSGVFDARSITNAHD